MGGRRFRSQYPVRVELRASNRVSKIRFQTLPSTDSVVAHQSSPLRGVSEKRPSSQENLDSRAT